MKMFEEWFEINNYLVDPHACTGVSKEDLAAVWKAALEYVLDNKNSYCPGQINGYDEWEDCPMAIVIKKELEQ